jgi:trans-2,3-dihydro-3-hydroxyanthranilate isomerase
MTMTAYVVLDVFTDRPFGGNPLAVIPDAASLPDGALQQIAREFNFSETTFVYPPDDPAHTARVRIFTPTSELPFAGHPTIGTAIALANRGAGPDMALELGVGPIEAHASQGLARFTTRTPLSRLGQPDPGLVAACAGLEVSDLRADAPPVIASVGVPFLLVAVAEAETLARAAPDVAALRRVGAENPSIANGFLYLYARKGTEVRARMFAPLEGIPEDPATGSAAAALGAHLADLEGGSVDLDITQGVEMGRPSRIEIGVRGDAITVFGKAVEVMHGKLTLPAGAG